jgi:hypothetical protein
MLYVALSRSRGFSQMVANKDILGDLSDESLRNLRSLPKAQYAAEYQKALESTLANTLAKSGIRETTQSGRSKDDVMKLSPAEKLDELLKRAQKGTKKLEVAVEKIAELAAGKVSKEIKRTIKRAIFKV